MQKFYTIIFSLMVIVPGSIFSCGCFGKKRTEPTRQPTPTMETVVPETWEEGGDSLGMGAVGLDEEVGESWLNAEAEDPDAGPSNNNKNLDPKQQQKIKIINFITWAGREGPLKNRPNGSPDDIAQQVNAKVNKLIAEINRLTNNNAETGRVYAHNLHKNIKDHRSYPEAEQKLVTRRVLKHFYPADPQQ